MSTAGTSGTHDTNMFNLPNTGSEGAAGKVKETGKVDANETPAPENAPTSKASSARAGYPNTGKAEGDRDAAVIEVLTQEPGSQTRSTDSLYFSEEMPSSGFRWWYIPAIAAPVAMVAGTTLTVVLLLQRRRRQELKAAELAAAAKATRNWLDALRMRQVLAQANNLVAPGLKLSRNPAQKVPVQASFWRDVVTDPVAAWRDLVADSVNAWRDLSAGSIGSWRDLVAESADRWRKLAVGAAQPYVNTAKSQVVATRTSASSAVNSAGEKIGGTLSHTLAFTLGALVAAAATYVLRWRQRMIETESEL
ncbi:MAG: hypothetical protein ACLQUY_28445 [Ktedonobacterales bacterium]